MTITKPCNESNTAKSIWNNIERLSVIARTADIHVRARSGNTTQELQSDALLEWQTKQHYVDIWHTLASNQTPVLQSIRVGSTKAINVEITKQLTIQKFIFIDNSTTVIKAVANYTYLSMLVALVLTSFLSS